MTKPFHHIILNVDDNEGARYAKTRIFERAGYRVLEASTGGEALKLVHQERPHLVLLDVGLPDINGLEVCRQIKNNVATAQVMVLQVSASCVRPIDRAVGLAGGADVYLTEPVESTELLGAAKALLRLYDRDEEMRVLLKELTARERFIKSLVDAVPSTVYLYDLEHHRNLYANTKSDGFLGCTSDDLILVDPTALKQSVHQDDLPEVLQRLERLSSLKDGEILEFECRLQHRSREWRWINFRNVVFARNGEGQPIQILGTAQDITDRKQNEQSRMEREEELRRAEQRWTVLLEQKVTERTGALSDSRSRLRALASQLTLVEQRERQRIAGELHDHLAQLLVLGRMKLGQAKREELPPRSRGFIEESDDMLAQALTYTRSLVVELSPPILRESGLPQAIKWLAEQMRLRDMTVAVDCDINLEWVNDDQSVLLFQSARELLINVSKHAGTPRASISVWIKDKLLHLCVADDGEGFDSSKIWTNGKGTRFGLFSIRERMEDLGGRMSIESAPEQGTRITLIVPLERTPLKWGGVRPAGKSDYGQALVEQRTFDTAETEDALPDIISRDIRQTSVSRVLLVDDHALLRQGLRKVLEEYADIEVVGEATDGAHAVILAKSLKPDIVIMDVNMPRMDGIEATRQLKKELPGTIFIGLSVDNNEAVEEAMREAGAVSFLTKDVASEQLHETIVQALRLTI